jgi:hypothetical protein
VFHKTLGRIDFLIASLGQRSFVLSAFEPHFPLAQDGLIACFQFLQRCQGQFEFGRLQGCEHFPGDSGIEQIATEAHAVFAGQTFAA